MSFPRYPNYKDSGVEWLGEVPAHWKTANLRWLSKRYSGGTPDKLNLEYWTEGTIPWLNSGAVNEPIITEPSAFITEEAFQNSSAKWIPKDALVMALAGQGKTKGMVAQLGFQTTCNQSMAAIIPTKEVEARFLYWWLTINYQNIRNMAGGDLRDGLNLELLGNIPCPLLPIPEQQTIAAFLDRETAKIDALIAEQQRLIGLLKEKRQAVISHAVTKGLNPDAPMKDSGIEWLGEVPAHWDIKRLKFIADVQSGVAKGKDNSGQETIEVPYLRVANVQDGFLDLETITTIEIPASSLERYLLRVGDVLMNEGGDYDKLGRGHIWNGEIELCIHQNHVFAIRPRGLSSEWLNEITGSDYAHFYFMTRSKQSTNLASISSTNIMELPVVIPPITEQQQILMSLSDQRNKFDTLTAEAQRAIQLLKERRAALISAAVTGKIDVHGLA
jgi:type I restriction enzyme S subunit